MAEELNPDGTPKGEVKSFHVHLGETYRNDDEIKALPKLDDLAAGYKTRGATLAEKEKLLADKEKELSDAKARAEGALKPPTDKSTPEEVAAWNKALGIPDDEKGYEIGGEKPAPVDLLIAKTLKEAKAPKAVGQAVHKALSEYGAQVEAEKAKQREEGLKVANENLKKEFGNDYDRRMEAVRKTVFSAMDDKSWEAFRKTEFGNDVKFISVLSDIGLDMSEGRYVKGVGTVKSDLAKRLYGPQK